MPNTCNNLIFIRGEREQIKEFADEALADEEFNLRACLPATDCPSGERIYRPSEGHPFSYEMSVLGTTGICEYTFIEVKPESIIIDAESAWTPPTKWAKHICLQARFSSLNIKIVYWEMGQQFYGYSESSHDKHVEVKYDLDFKKDIEDDEDYYIPRPGSMFYHFLQQHAVFDYYDESDLGLKDELRSGCDWEI
jgi:hypothetical protein